MKFDLYRKIRYRRGFGVHSPFVYNLINQVINEKHSYYAFEEIENFRKTIENGNDTIASITRSETQSPAYGALLFRLVNFFKCKNVIEIGASTGVMGLYLGMTSRSQCNCLLLEERSGLMLSLQTFISARHLSKIRCEEGNFLNTIPDLQHQIETANLIFLNQTPLTNDALGGLIKPFINPKNILVIDAIGRNNERKQMWKQLRAHPQTRVMIDLDVAGLVFFNERLPKRTYKAYLKHGKKQNLHKNGRPRLHLFSRWKKGSQNTSAHRSLRHH
ncbi:MAG: hypothetical protein LBS25_09525 [Candidatus Symbiothrix sp.]|jgi:predicted O-methyltransferase YrrM|nr:hypothetical protein [Candidatus Symbiothrix sp.]